MTKSNKSTAAIRRRKNKPFADLLQKARKTYLSRNVPPQNSEEKDDVFLHREVLRSSAIEKIMSSDKAVFLGLLVIRLTSAILMQTSFVADEFWQSVEVAHNMIFDYGYLTWEWKVGIRSYVYPLLFATLYKILAILGLDNRMLMVRGPRLLQGAMASVGDLYVFLLSRRLAGREVGQWTLLCQLLSWFLGYCCTRTLSNSMETVLVTAALFYFPWPSHVQPKGYTRRFVLLAASSVVVRPTAAVVWILLCSWHLQQSKGPALWSALKLYVTAGLTVLCTSTMIDRVWYGRWVFVHLNFLQFNVLTGGSGFYGRHPWHWYLTQGLPVTMGLHLLPFAIGVWRAKNKVLCMLIIRKVFVLSMVSHKEFRFLLPILPMAMHYCGVYFHSATQPPCPPKAKKKEAAQDRGAKQVGDGAALDKASDSDSKQEEGKDCNGLDGVCKEEDASSTPAPNEEGEAASTAAVEKSEEDKEKAASHEEEEEVAEAEKPDDNESGPSKDESKEESKDEDSTPSSEEKEKEIAQKRRGRKVRYFVLLLAVYNLFPLLYFSLIHQRGTIDVMNYLHDTITGRKGQVQRPAESLDILFLMPCHSTPYYSFLHANVSMRFLTCEPNLAHVANYTDEAEVFYQNPGDWLKREYQTAERQLPTHIIYFSVLHKKISRFLTLGGYKRCSKFFHIPRPEGRVGSYVLVGCREH